MRATLWSVRIAGLAVVGVLTFLALPSAHGVAATQAVAYVLLCAGVAFWGLAEFSPSAQPMPRRRTARSARAALPVALGVVVVAGCLGAAVGGGGDSMIAFAAVAVMSVAEAFSLRAALTVALLGVLATEIGGIAFDQGVGTDLGFPLLLVVAVLFGRNRASLRVQAEQARQLLTQHEQLRAEQRRADVLEERTRIAREIHDVLAHSLGALGVQLQTIEVLLTDHDDRGSALERLAAARRMATEGLTETRRAVHALRSGNLPLFDELARTAAECERQYHVGVRCQVSGTPVSLPPDATVALLRIAQESLVNAVKHAPGADIAVDLDYPDDNVRLTITNQLTAHVTVASPGEASDPRAAGLRTADSGFGLTGMRERLRPLGGRLEAGERDGRWTVTAELPGQWGNCVGREECGEI
ncbi:MAG TPA: sensor histidine kinase [Trebonia sp.]|nr:sensor histidine kinase [Trebonia sp.]